MNIPALRKRLRLPDLPDARHAGAGISIGSFIHVFGGETKQPTASHYRLELDDMLMPRGKWEALPNLPTSRGGLSAAVVGTRLFVFGGRIDVPFNVVEAYDTETKQWKACATPAVARSHPACAVIGTNIHLLGGSQRQPGGGAGPGNAHEIYDVKHDRWSPAASLPFEVYGHGCVEVDGKLIIAGGSTSSCAAYDPGENKWTALPVWPGAHNSSTISNAVVRVGRSIFIFGAYAPFWHDRRVWRFDVDDKVWSIVERAELSVARGGAYAAVAARGGYAAVIIAGGAESSINFDPVHGAELYGFEIAPAPQRELIDDSGVKQAPYPAGADLRPPLGEIGSDELVPEGIYKPDDRIEARSIRDLQRRALAGAVGAVVWKSSLTQSADKVTYVASKLRDVLWNKFQKSPAAEVKFVDQPGLALGTAFSIAPQVIATAAHVLLDHDRNLWPLESLRIVFGWATDASGNVPSEFSVAQVYGLAEIIRWRYVDIVGIGVMEDWAIVKLDRPATHPGAMQLPLAEEPALINVWSVAHGFGLPAKYCEGRISQIKSPVGPRLFRHNVAGMPGASGSPLIESSSSFPAVVGIHAAGPAEVWVVGADDRLRLKMYEDEPRVHGDGQSIVDIRRFIGTRATQLVVEITISNDWWSGTSHRLSARLNDEPENLLSGPYERGGVYKLVPTAPPSSSAAEINKLTLRKESHTSFFTDDCKIAKVRLISKSDPTFEVFSKEVNFWLNDSNKLVLVCGPRWTVMPQRAVGDQVATVVPRIG